MKLKNQSGCDETSLDRSESRMILDNLVNFKSKAQQFSLGCRNVSRQQNICSGVKISLLHFKL